MALSRRVWLLGGLRTEVDGAPVRVPAGNAQRLFIYLILHADTPHTREQLADLLWPSGAPDRVGRYLSDLLYRLRQAIGEGWIVAQATHITIETKADLWVDVWEFESLCRHNELPCLQEAVALYAGDLAPEIYDDWIVPHRVSLEEKYLTCLLHLGRAAEHSNEHETAHQYYERIRQQNPLYEEAYRGVMRNLAGMGRLTDALDVYDQLETVLDEELGAPPALETRALADQLRSDAALQRTGRHRARRPLIGRISERGILLDRLEQARDGDGGAAIVLGNAGIGKSRLLEELAHAAGWRGWQIAWGHGEQFTQPAMYAPLIDALRDALPHPRIQQLKQIVAPAWLEVVGRIIPAFDDFAPQDRDDPESSAEQKLPIALYHLLAGLQHIAPHLLLLDDVQWADPAIWPLLDALHPHLSKTNTLIVLSGRLDALREQDAAWNTITAWERAGTPIINLRGLSLTEIKTLADTRHAGTTNMSPDDIAQLHVASGGNPLLALTLLEREEPDDIPADSSLITLFRRRLTRLPAPAMHALQAAAVLGYRFTYELWEAVVEDVEPADLPQIAGALERTQILVIENDAYRFAHDTLRAAAYHMASDDIRRRLHRRTLDALRQHRPDNAVALVYHAEQAGASRHIATYALRAGHDALGAFSYDAAIDYFSRALAALPNDDLSCRYEALIGRLRARHILAERDAQRDDIAALKALAEALDAPDKQAEVAGWEARFAWATGALTEAERAAKRGIPLAQQAGAQEIEANLLHLLGQVIRNQGAYTRAQGLVKHARELYTATGSRRGEALATDLLGGIAWNVGDHPTAAKHHAAAADLFQELGDLHGEAQALNNLGTACWGLGDYARARKTHRRALAVNRELGNSRGEGDNLDNLGGVAWVLGDYDEAISLYQQALTIRQDIEDRWGISISLGNLGSAYRLKGEWETALAYYDRALALNRETGRRSGQGYNLHGRGLALLDAGRYNEARDALEAAYEIRQQLGETSNRLETVAGLILTCLAADNVQKAESYAHEAESLLAAIEQPRAALRQWVAFALYSVHEAAGRRETAFEHLCHARDAMLTIAEPLTDDDRFRFLKHVPLNCKIRTALASHSRTRTIRLVHVDVPLGRPLSDNDYVETTWTLQSPCDTVISNSVERRRHVLRRLLTEAADQNAAPTDADLADALDVSTRTIARDIAALQAAGYSAPTRRR